MSSTAAADAASSFEIRDPPNSLNRSQKVDVVPSLINDHNDHDTDAPVSIATDPDSDNEHREPNQKDDPATMAASEELKHTTISDKVVNPKPAEEDPSRMETGLPLGDDDKAMGGTAKESTPEVDTTTDAQDEEMRERISSPKKKRGRDQDEDLRDLEGDKLGGAGSTAEGHTLNGSRTMRSGPEKKRPRDTSEDPSKANGDIEVKIRKSSGSDSPTASATEKSKSSSSPGTSPKIFGSILGEKPAASAFAASGFGALAGSTTSPFGTIGASKPSVFGSKITPTTSGFGILAGANSSKPAAPTGLGTTSGDKGASGFRSGFGAPTTGFGALSSGSGFGASLANGFAGGSGLKLSSFAAPGKENVIVGAKPARAFGAPESDAEDSDDDGSEGGADLEEDEEAKVHVDDKKKSKITKVVEDGEEDEATLLQVRAKLFALASKEVGWKERGVGTIKLNAPKDCVEIDDNGVVISGSFDSSMLEDRVVRLIMRQENTHRVILNTFIVKAMEFIPKPSSSPPQLMFTAFEGEPEPKPINMLLKMSEANYKLFKSEIDSIQREL